jgi:hypothetical protein
LNYIKAFLHAVWVFFRPTIAFLGRSISDPSIFWVMLGAGATVALIFVAYRQLRDLARTSRSDFLYRLKTDFFNERTRQLVFLAENDLLEFRAGDIPYFAIIGHERPGVKDRLRELKIRDQSLSTYLIDDLLLGPIEDIGVLESMGLVSLEEAYEVFVTYINISMENKAIKEYLGWSDKDPNDDDVYDHARALYEKLNEESRKIRAKKRKRSRISRRDQNAPLQAQQGGDAKSSIEN